MKWLASSVSLGRKAKPETLLVSEWSESPGLCRHKNDTTCRVGWLCATNEWPNLPAPEEHRRRLHCMRRPRISGSSESLGERNAEILCSSFDREIDIPSNSGVCLLPCEEKTKEYTSSVAASLGAECAQEEQSNAEKNTKAERLLRCVGGEGRKRPSNAFCRQDGARPIHWTFPEAGGYSAVVGEVWAPKARPAEILREAHGEQGGRGAKSVANGGRVDGVSDAMQQLLEKTGQNAMWAGRMTLEPGETSGVSFVLGRSGRGRVGWWERKVERPKERDWFFGSNAAPNVSSEASFCGETAVAPKSASANQQKELAARLVSPVAGSLERCVAWMKAVPLAQTAAM